VLSVYLLLVVIPIAVIAYIVWDHKRKAAAREAASAGRFREILGTVERAQAPDDPSVTAPTPGETSSETTISAIYARRDRVLDPSRTLLYYLLRTSLPDYVIFAQVPLSSVVEPASHLSNQAREECATRLASRTIDFLVTDRNMQPIAGIQLLPAVHATAALLVSALEAAGVRYIAFDAAALPRKDAMRGVVLGEAPVGSGAQTDASSHTT
jgi:hypothetical protein